MILPEKLSQNFVNCFLKDWDNITKEEHDMLTERCYLLNKEFTFTKRRMQKLQSLSDMLKAEELRVLSHVQKIYAQQKQWFEKRLINDYEVDVHISCWYKHYFEKRNEKFYGNPFFKDRHINLFHENQDSAFYTDNWNEYQSMKTHVLKDQFHCYTLHHLYDHTILSWFDIIKIDSVWIEVIVLNQFFSSVKNR